MTQLQGKPNYLLESGLHRKIRKTQLASCVMFCNDCQNYNTYQGEKSEKRRLEKLKYFLKKPFLSNLVKKCQIVV